MSAVATHLDVLQSVFWSLQKQRNRSRCHLVGWL